MLSAKSSTREFRFFNSREESKGDHCETEGEKPECHISKTYACITLSRGQEGGGGGGLLPQVCGGLAGAQATSLLYGTLLGQQALQCQLAGGRCNRRMT